MMWVMAKCVPPRKIFSPKKIRNSKDAQWNVPSPIISARNAWYFMWNNSGHTKRSWKPATHQPKTQTNCAATKWWKRIILTFCRPISRAAQICGTEHGVRVSRKMGNWFDESWLKWGFFLVFAECFDCDPETIPPTGNITALCTVKASVAGLQDSTTMAQSCFTNTQGNVCTDCANLYEAMMAKYKLQKSVTGGDLCFDVKDAVSRQA